MNVTNHVKRRYCERFLGMKDNTEIKRYIVQNEEILKDNLFKLFEYATFLWKGQLGDNVTRNFYIKDENILVTDTNNTALITIYKVDFGFPKETNKKVTKDLVKEIEKLQKEHQKSVEFNNKTIDKRNLELVSLEKQIQALEEQLKLLKRKKAIIEEDVKVLGTNANYILKEIDKYAVQLCNSLDYKNDLLDMRKAG